VRRWVLLLVALAIAAGPVAYASPASAEDVCGGQGGPCIAVTNVATGTTQYVTSEDITNTSDIPQQDCSIRKVPYGPESDLCNPITDGLSIQAVVNQVVPDLSLVRLVQVSGFAGNPSTLTADELATPSPFENSWEPVFGQPSPGTNISYERPLLDNQTDTNASDNQITSDNGQMTVSVYTTGQVLHPSVTLSTTKAKIGVPITATATLAPGESANNLTYDWNFYSGPVDSEPATTTHTYAKGSEGTAYVSVTVERGLDTPTPAYGISAPVLVHVGKAAPPATKPPSDGPTSGTGTGNKHHPVVGPNKGKGHNAGAAPGHRSGGAGSTTPTTPAPGQPSQTTGGATTAPAGGAANAPTGSATAPTGGATRSRKSTPSPPAGADFGALVHGVVIDSAGQPVAPPRSSPTVPRGTAESARARSTQPFDARLLWWLLLPVLLGLGVLTEVRRPDSARRSPTS
jgi:hypothetical protein